ncbi:MAG: aldolase [Chitinophagaceae bacterium]|jgi:class I fructose-bisphosphate aldolase/fructose-bisphosphate aldolase/6-deoxy-5-ketofructose 1-phosphate synthase|nr:MAG: aldolase [Chitinophagaceae bacterium]
MNHTDQITEDHFIPADVPHDKTDTFKNNFNGATGNTGRLMLFAGDQKLEHCNNDFYGQGISPDDADPRHLFQIASEAHIGVFATQLGLMSRYALQYPDVPYLVKLNSKTNLVSFKQRDPLSRAWFTVDQVVKFAESTGLKIAGVGYTVYPGSDYEAEMLKEAAQIVHQAHLNGLFAVLWMYPKGKAVSDEHDPHLIAGAAGIGACLGADFVKLKVPEKNGEFNPDMMNEIVAAAGNTGVLCEGGTKENETLFLQQLHDQIHLGGARGSGTGRNIHQRSLQDSIKMANAIHAITLENKTVEEAVQIL